MTQVPRIDTGAVRPDTDALRQQANQTLGRNDDDLAEFRVPITVFTCVRAVDFADAVFIAERALKQAFVTSSLHRPDGPLTVQAKFDKQNKPAVPVEIHQVCETGSAARNGLLWIEPTNDAYRSQG